MGTNALPQSNMDDVLLALDKIEERVNSSVRLSSQDYAEAYANLEEDADRYLERLISLPLTNKSTIVERIRKRKTMAKYCRFVRAKEMDTGIGPEPTRIRTNIETSTNSRYTMPAMVIAFCRPGASNVTLSAKPSLAQPKARSAKGQNLFANSNNFRGDIARDRQTGLPPPAACN